MSACDELAKGCGRLCCVRGAYDVFTWILMALTVGVILLRNVGPLPLMASGAVIELLAKNEFVERLAEWAW